MEKKEIEAETEEEEVEGGGGYRCHTENKKLCQHRKQDNLEMEVKKVEDDVVCDGNDAAKGAENGIYIC